MSTYAPERRTRPDLCAQHGHPGVTFNPWFGPGGRTWCLCGAVTYDGRDRLVPHVACCGGPLEETVPASHQPEGATDEPVDTPQPA